MHPIPVKHLSNDLSLAVCIKPFHSQWDHPLWLIEFIELYRLLGASHFMFYLHSGAIGSDTERVLLEYVRNGVVSILEWVSIDIMIYLTLSMIYVSQE